jgi:hypothetical protein
VKVRARPREREIRIKPTEDLATNEAIDAMSSLLGRATVGRISAA